MSLTLTRNPNPDSTPLDGAPVQGVSIPSSDLRLKGMDPEELLARFIAWHKIDRDAFQPMRQEMAEMFDFTAGHQWTDEDLQILQDQMRPAITFNRIGPFIDAVGGMEINNRQETRYAPRTVGDSGVDDLLTGAAQWVRQECDAEDEETEAFLDVVKCGLGCTHTHMDYDDNPDGIPIIDRVNPLEMMPDAGAVKQNYSDGRHVMRIKDIPIDDALNLDLDADEDDLDADWARDQPDEARTPHNARLAPYYRVDQAGRIDHERDIVRMVEVEWWQFMPAWRVLDPQSQRWVLLDEGKAMRWAMACRMAGIRAEMKKDKKKKYFKAIVGKRVLKVMDGAGVGGFEHKFITGKRDQMKGIWYGPVRAMRDPQLWANKWLSQGLHILNSNAKGGLLAETDAFADIDQARDSWAEADSIVELNPGGLDKVKSKDPPAFPPQLNTMMEMASAAIPQVSGINMEMLGQSTSTAPQVALLEQGRKQQGMNILAGLFNAKRRYQKEQGRLLLWMIQTYIADGRLIRIGGPENAKYVPLVHTPGLAEYDVIVDDAPTSTNMKERVWGALMQMFPILKGMQIPPQFYVNALKYAPVPESFIEESQKILSQPPPPNPAMQGKEAESQAKVALMGAQTQKAQADTHKVATEAGLMGQMPVNDLDQEQKKADIELTRAKAINELQNAGIIDDDNRFDQTMQAIQALDTAHKAYLAHVDQAHKHMMDKMTHSLQRDQAAHGAQMDMAGHALQTGQAAHGAQMDVAGHSLERQQAAHGAEMAEAGHSLAEQQAEVAAKQAAAAQAAKQQTQGR